MPDGNKTGLNNTTSGVLTANLCGRKYLREENNLHFVPFSLWNIQGDTSSSACNTNNRSIPVVLPRNHPRDSNTRRRKNSNIATLNREPTITKNSSNTVLVYSWPTPFRLHQWRSEMCDFVCKYCFIHWDLAKRLYHRKPPPHLRVPSHCKEPYYRPSRWSRLVYYKKTQVQVPGIFTGSWFWNNVDVASADQITAWNHLSDCWHCQRLIAMLKHLATTSTSIGGQFPGCVFGRILNSHR